MSKAKMSMKILVDKTKHKVLFAEASKECADFLFDILSLPLGSMMDLLLDGNISSLEGKDVSSCSEVPPILTMKPATESYYTCSVPYHRLFGFDAFCPLCNLRMCTPTASVGHSPAAAKNQGESAADGGCGKETVTYMIMDNLSVQPLSTISGIELLTKFDVQGRLEEKLVFLDMNMGSSLLKTTLTSKNVLTDTFLPKKVSDGS